MTSRSKQIREARGYLHGLIDKIRNFQNEGLQHYNIASNALELGYRDVVNEIKGYSLDRLLFKLNPTYSTVNKEAYASATKEQIMNAFRLAYPTSTTTPEEVFAQPNAEALLATIVNKLTNLYEPDFNIYNELYECQGVEQAKKAIEYDIKCYSAAITAHESRKKAAPEKKEENKNIDVQIQIINERINTLKGYSQILDALSARAHKIRNAKVGQRIKYLFNSHAFEEGRDIEH